MKQLNFRHFNTNIKKFFETVNFLQKEAKTAPKRPILFCFVCEGIFAHFTTFSDYFRKRLPKIPEDRQRFPKTNEEVRPLPKMSEEPSKHLIVFSSETVNIEKLANLTANTKNYGQITLNTKPHSDPHDTIKKIVKKSVLYSTKGCEPFSCLPVDCKAVGFFSKSV